MPVFKDDDEAYEEWRRAHWETGYILAVPGRNRSGPAMLHQARCEHLNKAKGDTLTGNPKACSDNPSDLESWAKVEGVSLRGPCSACGGK
ncbi:MAG TPA: hypothetical protein VH482_33495 [Thermomicrobiales bacterium]